MITYHYCAVRQTAPAITESSDGIFMLTKEMCNADYKKVRSLIAEASGFGESPFAILSITKVGREP